MPKLRRRLALGVILVLSACGSNKAETVSDLQLARLTPDQLGPVDAARAELAHSKDEVGRQDLAVRTAENERRDAEAEHAATTAKRDQFQAAIKNAKNVDDPIAKAKAEQQLGSLQAKEDATAGHIRYADAELSAAQAQKTAAEKNRDLAEARVEQAKYQALVAAGDPLAGTISGEGLDKRVARAQRDAADANKVAAAKQLDIQRLRKDWDDRNARYESLNAGDKH